MNLNPNINLNLNRMLILFQKEVKSYFYSPLTYVMSALFIFLVGWIFFNTLVLSEKGQVVSLPSTVMTSLFGNINFLFLVVAPLMTMRLFSEEKKNQTLPLLLTSSLTPLQIIGGKFLGVFFMMSFMVALTFIFPIILSQSGDLDLPMVVTGYLGTFLNLATFISVGMFASSLTEGQVVSAVTSFCILFALLLLAQSPFVMNNFLLGQMFYYLSIPLHFEAFTRGVIRSMDFFYYFSLIGLMIFLTRESLESRNW